MTKVPAELMREFVRSQNFTSIDEIMTAMKVSVNSSTHRKPQQK